MDLVPFTVPTVIRNKQQNLYILSACKQKRASNQVNSRYSYGFQKNCEIACKPKYNLFQREVFKECESELMTFEAIMATVRKSRHPIKQCSFLWSFPQPIQITQCAKMPNIRQHVTLLLSHRTNS